MKTFLDDIAAELLKNGGNDFSQTCIVLPNRRAGVFLRDAISKTGKKAIWAPTILSIEDFVFSLSSLIKADQTTLLFTFYEVYKKYAKDPQTIELFAGWAPIFLSDANELDLNLIDAEDIYAQLYSIERIKKWNPEKTETTDFQQKHLDFVKQFYPFYNQLRKNLQEKRAGYQGMAFREVADNINAIIDSSGWEEVWFAGFNALTVSEEKILSAWKDSGKTKIFWDMDAFYADDNIHEAGHYIRRFTSGRSTLKLKSDYNWKAQRLSSADTKEINLIGAQRNMSQANIAGSVIQDRINEGRSVLTNTAVVLNDEQLLVPLLSALPTELDGVNITMGYGLRQSQSSVFVEHIFSLYDRYSEAGKRFYHEHVSAIENDPFYQLAQTGRRTNERPKQVYYSAEQLQEDEFSSLLFNDSWVSISGFLANLKELLNEVGKQLEDDSIEREFLFLLDKLAQRLIDLTDEFPAIDSIRTLHTFWRQLLRNQQLDFVGEPLTGLQVMGMLETRNLDFEEVIMLGVNEGNLPSSSHSPSYFTFDVRRAYGLACQNERDAVTAYHFYRLLQRAKRVHLVYDQDTDSLGGGEMSRYVKQLLMEHGENIIIRHSNIEQEMPESATPAPVIVKKGVKDFTKLRELAESGLSPSALNTFRSCSLKYYFRYVAGIKEPDEFKEDMDAAKLGTAIHDTLEEIYKPFVGKVLIDQELKEKKSSLEAILLGNFKKQLKTTEDLSGSDLLTFEVAKTYVKRVIDHDLSMLKSGQVITILKLEDELSRTVKVPVGDGHLSVRLKGKADRLDRLSDATIRVIDYKTGSFEKKLKISKKEDFEDPRSDNAFQMLMYRFMAKESLGADNISPMGFYLRSNDIEKPVSVFENKIEVTDAALLSYTNELLRDTLQNLFDEKQPFYQTEDAKRCEFCEFNGVCQR